MTPQLSPRSTLHSSRSARASAKPPKSPSGSAQCAGDRLLWVVDAHASGELSTASALRALSLLLSSDNWVVSATGIRDMILVAERLARCFRGQAGEEQSEKRENPRETKNGKPQRHASSTTTADGKDVIPAGDCLTDRAQKDSERVCVACAASDLWIDQAQASLRLLRNETNWGRGDMDLLVAAAATGRGSGGGAGSRAAQRRRRKKCREGREAVSLAASAHDGDDNHDETEETGGVGARQPDGNSGDSDGAALVKAVTSLTQAIAARIRVEANRKQFCLPTLTSLVRRLHRLALLPLLQPSSELPPETLSPVSSWLLLVDLFPPLRRVLRDSVAAVLDVLAMKPGTRAFSVSEEEGCFTLKSACAEMLHHVLHQSASLSLFSSSLTSLSSALRSSCFDLAFDENEDLAFYGRSTLCRLTWIFRRTSAAAASLAASGSSLASTSTAPQDEGQEHQLSFEAIFEQTVVICSSLFDLCNTFLGSALEDGSSTEGRGGSQSTARRFRMQGHQGRQPISASRASEGGYDERETSGGLPDAVKHLRAKNEFQRAVRAIQLLRDLLLFGSGQAVPKEGALGVSLAPFEREGGRFMVVNVSACLGLLRAFLDTVMCVFHKKAEKSLGMSDSHASDDTDEASSEAEIEALSEPEENGEGKERTPRKRGRDGRQIAVKGNHMQLTNSQGDHGDQKRNGKTLPKWMKDKDRSRQPNLGISACGSNTQKRDQQSETEDEDRSADPGGDGRKAACQVPLANAYLNSAESLTLYQHLRLTEADVFSSPLLEYIFTATIECVQALLDVTGDAGVMADVTGFASFARTLLQASTIDAFPSMIAARFSGIICSFLHSLFTTAPFLFPPLADLSVGWTASVLETLGARLPLDSCSASPHMPPLEETSQPAKAFRKLRLVSLCRAVYAEPFFQLGQVAVSRRGASCSPLGEWRPGAQTGHRNRRALEGGEEQAEGFSSVDERGQDSVKKRQRRRRGHEEERRASIFAEQASLASLQDNDGLHLILCVWRDTCRLLGLLLTMEASRSLRGELALTRLRGAADGMCLDILLSGLVGPTTSPSLASPLADMVVSDTPSLTATLRLLHISLARGSMPPSQQTVEAVSTLLSRLNRFIDGKRRSLWMGDSCSSPGSGTAETDDGRLSVLLAAIEGIRNCLSLRRSSGIVSCLPSLVSENSGVAASLQQLRHVWKTDLSRSAKGQNRNERSSFVELYRETVEAQLILGAIEASEEMYRQSRAQKRAKAKASGQQAAPEGDASDTSKDSDEESEARDAHGEQPCLVKQEHKEMPQVARGNQVESVMDDRLEEKKERDAELEEEGNAPAGEDDEPVDREEEHDSRNADEKKASGNSAVSDASDAGEDEESDSEELVSLIERIRQKEEDDFDGLQSDDDGDMDF
ncbi:hypothetical protein TGMAS_203760 [Toxoplasma gondii MAS]|uniref:Uncharacterized protein n=2 Tax=Toxoplasma gondii TaxID=5811 RepID=A0A086PZ50_TOXGO|nr:hypothetical protein TGMAS_203760 [Toxoplasma gondii MAS]PUA89319.1 hypothetical protein TGBR9_203760 [Toxoplasma gondii TgCATBr9]